MHYSESSASTSVTPERRKRLHYLGDFNDEDVTSPSKAKKVLEIAQQQNISMKRKIKLLDKQNKRLKKRVASLDELLTELKTQNLISDSASTILGLSGAAGDFIERLECSNSRAEYSEDLRTFAMTLNFYSAKAYNYVRQMFNKVKYFL
ncbi:uncharacterized protein LOC118193477 [Stegodyphus dumicola]|uniref:uncharacterized protein LOC118193477 n=1 Tax=Stegodyphus dumicola TaxID=202533 RepID=UPI0015ADBF37|nr:uncharacterized protein LOC118193477 [Stegodyphus dumicola]